MLRGHHAARGTIAINSMEMSDSICAQFNFHYIDYNAILDYAITVSDAEGGLSFFSTNTQSFVAGQLRCCSEFTYQVAARTSVGVGVPSQVLSFRTSAQFNGKNNRCYDAGVCIYIYLLLADIYHVSINAGADWIRVSWRTSSSILQQQLRSVEVMVTSECFTGIMTPQTQTFNVMPHEGNSITVTGLGTI